MKELQGSHILSGQITRGQIYVNVSWAYRDWQVQKCWFSCVVSYPKKIAKSFSAHQDLASSSWGFLAFHSRLARLNNLSPRHSAHIFHLQDEKEICGVSKSWGHPMVGNPMPQSITKNLKAGFILNEIMYYIRLPLIYQLDSWVQSLGWLMVLGLPHSSTGIRSIQVPSSRVPRPKKNAIFRYLEKMDPSPT